MSMMDSCQASARPRGRVYVTDGRGNGSLYLHRPGPRVLDDGDDGNLEPFIEFQRVTCSFVCELRHKERFKIKLYTILQCATAYALAARR